MQPNDVSAETRPPEDLTRARWDVRQQQYLTNICSYTLTEEAAVSTMPAADASATREPPRQPITGTAPVEGLDSMPLERLEREIGELAAHINAATCRWLELVAELERREGWGHWGCRSCADWLSLRCGVAPGAAREQVRVARHIGELALVRDAFATGALSYSKVRAITRVATPENEAELLELALHATAAQLERIARGYRGAASADLGHANAVDRERYLSWTWDDDGALVIRGRLSADEGALLLRALEAAWDGLATDPEPAPDPACDSAPGQHCSEPLSDVSAETSGTTRASRSNADALVAIADASLASPDATRNGGDRYQVVVHTDAAALAGDPDGHSEIEDGPALPSQTARRAACDAAVVTIAERDGRPLTVGRKTRTVPPALRRALRSRDRCCRFPGCTQRRFVDAHHIEHWADGGHTKLSNLMLLCRRHHRLLHEGGYSVERPSSGSIRFRRPDGRPIPTAMMHTSTQPDEIRQRNRRAALPIVPETPAARSGGGPFAVDVAVEGLLARDGLLELVLLGRESQENPGAA